MHTIRQLLVQHRAFVCAFIVWQVFFFVDGVSVVEAQEQGRLEARREVAATARMLGESPADWLSPAEGRLTAAGRELWTQAEEMAATAADPVAVAWSRMTHSGLGSAQLSSNPGFGQSVKTGESKPAGSNGTKTLRPRLRRSAAPPRAVSISESDAESRAKTRAQTLALGSTFAGAQISDARLPALRAAAVKARTVDASTVPRSTAGFSALAVPSTLAGAAGASNQSSKDRQKTIAPEITALAASLENSPARIFRHIHDSIDFDPKWGVDSPPLGTLWERRGTSWDQTWLLQELLIAAGVDARLEWGEVEIGPDLLLQITGVYDAFRAGDLLSTAGLPVVLIVSGGQVIAARMPHAWVKAHLDYIPNRGVTHDQGDTWIRLDPSLKRYTSQDATRLDQDVPFVLEDHLNSGTTASPRTDYETALQDHITAQNLGITLEQAKPAHSLRAEEFPFIPGTLRAKVLTVSGESMEVPGTFQTRFNLEINAAEGGELLSWSAPLSTVYGQLLEMRWPGATAADQGTIDSYGDLFATPPYEVQVRPTIRLGGGAVASGSAIGAAEDAVLKVTVTPPAGLTGDGTPIVASWDLYAGEHGALAFDFGRAPAEIIALTTQEAAGATDPEDVEAWSLSAAAATYLHSSAGDLDHLAGLNHHRAINLGTAVLAVQRGAVSTTPEGTPDTFSRGPLSIDVGARTLGVFAVDGNTVSTVPTLELVGSQGSVREGEALASVFGGDHVTAVGFLKEAVRQGQTLTRVDLANVNQALTAANLSSGAEGAVRFAVEQGGAIAWISQTQLEINGWRTTGYILEDPITGIGGYFVTYEREFRPLEGAVTFHSPSDLDIITAPTDVVATMDVEDIETWTLSTRPVGGEAITPIVSGTGPVNNTLLGQFDPTLLLNGMHELILTGRNAAGESITGKITLVVEGNMKIGHFTLSFVDLAIPLSGLDLEIIRTYDSRRRNEKGDFGYGWTLDIRQGSYKNNRPPGDGWQILPTGGPFGLPCQQVAETKSHLTTVRLSDQEVYRFRLTLKSPGTVIGGCIGRAEFEYVDGPLPGTTLEVLGNDEVIYQNASDRVLDRNTLEPFVPDDVKLTTRDGRIFHLDLQDGVTHLEDLHGNTLEITPAGITHSSGRGVQFVRDGEGRITEIVDPRNTKNVYSYDANGDLEKHTDRAGAETAFIYSDHYLEDIVNALGIRAVRTEYDADGRMAAMTDAAGKVRSFEHDLSGRREVSTSPLGFSRVMEYDDRGNVTYESNENGEVTLRQFDHKDRILAERNPLGEETQYSYSLSNDLTSFVDPLGNRTTIAFHPLGVPTTVTDPLGFVTQYDVAPNGTVSWFRDPLGNQTDFGYTQKGDLRSVTDALGNTMTFGYDLFGNVTRSTDALGNITTYSYDERGNQLGETLTRTLPDGSSEMLTTVFEYDELDRVIKLTAPDGSVSRTSYDLLGRPKTTSDPLGRVTNMHYDERGRLVRITYPDGTSVQTVYDDDGRRTRLIDQAGRETKMAYDPAGRLLNVAYAGPGSPKVNYSYNSAGRLISVENARGFLTRFEHDALGRKVKEIDALGNERTIAYDGKGRVLSLTDPEGHTTSYEYDPLNRQRFAVAADGSKTESIYDSAGRRVAAVDQEGYRTDYGYDSMGRVTSVENALNQVTSYTYDERGNLIEQRDFNGNVTSFEYDQLGRQIARVLPDGARESMEFFADGKPRRHTTFTGEVKTFAYDTMGRLTSHKFSDGTEYSFSYSTTGRRLTATDRQGGVTTFEYDDRDRVVKKTNPNGSSLESVYDLDGNRTALTANVGSSSFTTSYAFDALGRIESITDSVSGVYSYQYNSNGQKTRLEYPNGLVTTWDYDSLNRLVELVTRRGSDTIQSYSYTLADTGHRARIDELGGLVREYEYDELWRLKREKVTQGEDLVYQQDFQYDSVGNRLQSELTRPGEPVGSRGYLYDNRDRIDREDGEPWLWDASGRLLSRPASGWIPAASFTWDEDDRLISAVRQGDGFESTLQAEYDPDGNLVSTQETVNGQERSTELLVDTTGPLGQIMASSDGDGDVTWYVRAGDQLLAQQSSVGSLYFHADGLGSIRAWTDSGGVEVAGRSYSAFGEPLPFGADVAIEETLDQPFGYTGEPSFASAGLSYHRLRWLDSATGRFASIDPMFPKGGDPSYHHLYRYAQNDPLNRIDPSGGRSFSVVGALTVLGVIGALHSVYTAFVQPTFFNVSMAVVSVATLPISWTKVLGHAKWGIKAQRATSGASASAAAAKEVGERIVEAGYKARGWNILFHEKQVIKHILNKAQGVKPVDFIHTAGGKYILTEVKSVTRTDEIWSSIKKFEDTTEYLGRWLQKRGATLQLDELDDYRIVVERVSPDQLRDGFSIVNGVLWQGNKEFLTKNGRKILVETLDDLGGLALVQ